MKTSLNPIKAAAIKFADGMIADGASALALVISSAFERALAECDYALAYHARAEVRGRARAEVRAGAPATACAYRRWSWQLRAAATALGLEVAEDEDGYTTISAPGLRRIDCYWRPGYTPSEVGGDSEYMAVYAYTAGEFENVVILETSSTSDELYGLIAAGGLDDYLRLAVEEGVAGEFISYNMFRVV